MALAGVASYRDKQKTTKTYSKILQLIRRGINFPGNHRQRIDVSAFLYISESLSAGIMKVTIKEWNAVASWRWDMPEDDVCGICRVQFDGTCPTCKYPGDDCTLRELQSEILSRNHSALKLTTVIGKCGHSFHMVRSYSYAMALTDDAELD